MALACVPVIGLASIAGAQVYVAPDSPRATVSFDRDWKFVREDVAGAEVPAFDDAKWKTVSTPHTYNDVDSFHKIISHSGGQRDSYSGPAWYRKTFKLPESVKGKKVFLEFEGLKQAGQFYLNGKEIGLYENGITAYGLDLTAGLKFGGEENVLAVRVDNSDRYEEKATKTGFEWMGRAFNPNYGGINRHVWMHVTGMVHQTLPLWEGLGTTGVYVYPENVKVADGSLDLHVEAQVANEQADNANVQLSVSVVDANGNVAGKFEGDSVDLVGGEKSKASATGHLTGVRLWSPGDPALYTVYTTLSLDGKVIDVARTVTGFRKTDYRGGAGKGGVYINDKFVWLTGFAQRSSDEWAGLGQAYPDWMHDLTAKLIRESNSNYVRWMHISPQKVDVDAFDRAGIVGVCPAGDKEKDVEGVQWKQRMAVMRASMIYFRNSPSILFWEAGNNGVSTPHLQEMLSLRKELDPSGGRVLGCRTLNEQSATPIAEYFGVMIGQDRRTDELKGPSDMFRAYSAERRDRAPLIETEDFRDEGARRFWDKWSPPHFGFKKGKDDTWEYDSDTFALAAVKRYDAYWSNRISNTDPAHSKWSGYASIYFSDSNADGRQDSSEVCRVSGKVDAVRIPKDIYFTTRVMQNAKPDLHILGHWTYPANTTKPIYVISNCDSVELFLDGKSLGKSSAPTDGFTFTFANVHFVPGTLRAVGYVKGKASAEMSLQTAGPAKAIKLTPITGPGGLKADGADVALFDVEVVDAEGRRCPTDEARVDFAVTGPGIWRGGYNSGKVDSINNLYLDTECGINRVAIRSTLTPGKITLTAKRNGLAPTTAEVEAAPTTDPLASVK
jgi:beta-galactosidase